MSDDHAYDAAASAADAAEAARDARDAAEEAARLLSDPLTLDDDQIARGVEDAMNQKALKDAAAEYERSGWRVTSVDPGVISLAAGPKLNVPVHALVSILTCGLWLFYLVPAMKKPRGEARLTLDHLGRITFQKL